MIHRPVTARRATSFLVLLWMGLVANAANADRTLTAEVFKPPTFIHDITVDKDGYVWFACDSGFFRFGGHQMREFPVPRSVGEPLYWSYWLFNAATKGDELWFGLGGGRYRFDRQADGTNAFAVTQEAVGGLVRVSLRVPSNTWEIIDLPGLGKSPPVWSLLGDAKNDQLWVGMSNGLARNKQGHWRLWRRSEDLPHDHVLSLALAENGGVDVGTLGGLAHVINDEIKPSTFKQPVTAIARGEQHQDGSHRLWLGSPAGLIELAVANGHEDRILFKLGADSGLPSNEIRDLAVDATGDVWIATARGLAHLHDGNLLTVPAGTPEDDTTSLAIDKMGAVWAGTLHQGAIRIAPPEVQNLDTRHGFVSDNMGAVAIGPSGSLWVATAAGLSLMPAGLLSQVGILKAVSVLDPKLPAGAPTSLATDTAGVWVAYADGSLMFASEDAATKAATITKLGSGPVPGGSRALASDGADFLWLGAHDGVALFRIQRDEHGHPMHLQEQRRFDTQRGFCAGTVISAWVSKSGDQAWFGTDGGGVARIEKRDGRPQCFGVADGLPGTTVTGIAQSPHGNIWVGMTDDHGIARFDGHSFSGLNSQNGLGCDNVRGLAARGTHIIVACAGGVTIARWDELERAISGDKSFLVNSFWNSQRGMSAEACSAAFPNVAVTTDGTAYVATERGLVTFADPFPNKETTTLGDVRIDRIWVGDKEVRDLTFPITIELSQPAVPVILQWSNGSEPGPDGRSYKVRWEFPDGRQSTEYLIERDVPMQSQRLLAQGTYKVSIGAVLAGGVQGAPATAVTFGLFVPWHKRAWVRWGAVTLLILMAAGGHRLRLYRMARRHAEVEEERTRIARELHDSLGQGLTSVGFHLGAAALALKNQRASSADEASEILERGQELLVHCKDEMRASIWQLRTANPMSVQEAITAAVEHHRRGATSNVPVVKLRCTGTHRRAEALMAQELAGVVTEALNNVVKHAHATRVDVILENNSDVVTLTITDNGCGFDGAGQSLEKHAEAGHFGLLGMAERVRRIHGKLSITSSANAGTTIRVTAALATG